MNGTPSQGPGLRYPSNKKSIYDRNLNRSKNAELSRAAFAYLFIEMIAYAQKGAKDVGGLEQRYDACWKAWMLQDSFAQPRFFLFLSLSVSLYTR